MLVKYNHKNEIIIPFIKSKVILSTLIIIIRVISVLSHNGTLMTLIFTMKYDCVYLNLYNYPCLS